MKVATVAYSMMMLLNATLALFALILSYAHAFRHHGQRAVRTTTRATMIDDSLRSGLDMLASNDMVNSALKLSLNIADTSISEEDILDVTGQASNLPSPLIGVGFALLIFAGVAVLQFSLGDLTKEEGQARVRDFLQTQRETERKRGYFD